MKTIPEDIKQSCLDFKNNPRIRNLAFKDISTYSQSDNERIPTVWSIDSLEFDFTVVWGHIYHPNNWILRCRSLGIDQKELSSRNITDVIVEALKICRRRINYYNAILNNSNI